MQIESHYVILVYPFFHGFSGADGASSLRDMEGRSISWLNRLVMDAKNNIDDSADRILISRVRLMIGIFSDPHSTAIVWISPKTGQMNKV